MAFNETGSLVTQICHIFYIGYQYLEIIAALAVSQASPLLPSVDGMSTLLASSNTPIDCYAQNKEDFGKLVRRIMLSSSGQFASMASDGRPIKETAVPQTPSPIWLRCKELAEGATNRCNYSQAEAMWLGALAEARTFDRRDPRLALTLESLASLYLALERYEQAEMFNRNALESLIAIYGPMHIKKWQLHEHTRRHTLYPGAFERSRTFLHQVAIYLRRRIRTGSR